jgi:DNA polymerase III alpha subunit
VSSKLAKFRRLPDGYTNEQFFRETVLTGIHKRYPTKEVTLEAALVRAEEELVELIEESRVKYDFVNYMLVGWDLYRYCGENKILVGPGRGSVAGAITAYALGLSNVCPIENDLLFARYMNRFRVSPPDIDMDFQASRRREVIEYAQREYGEDFVALISLKTRFKPRSAIDAAVRSLIAGAANQKRIGKELKKAMPDPVAGFFTPIAVLLNPSKQAGTALHGALKRYPEKAESAGYIVAQSIPEITWEQVTDDMILQLFVDGRFAALLPEETVAVQEAWKAGAEFRKAALKYPEIVSTALRLTGVKSASGIHACGVVISGESLVGRIGLGWDHAREVWKTEMDGKEVEDAGYQKFDFLSGKVLDVEAESVKLIDRFYDTEVDLEAIPAWDEKVEQLFKSGRTVGIFQVESKPMQELCQRLAPTRFSDIAAILALWRPGPISAKMPDLFADRKNGRAEVSYAMYGALTEFEIKTLADVLGTTYGTMVYQETSMRLSVVIAGFSPGESDMLRYALAKKDPEKTEKVGKMFLEQGVREHNGTPAFRSDMVYKIWQMIEGGSKYLFNACVAGDTIVETEAGSLTVEQIYTQRTTPRLLALTADGAIAFRPSKGVTHNGEKATVSIRLANGSFITSTLDHRHMSVGGWREAGTLVVGDLLVANENGTPGASAIVSIEDAGVQDVYDIEMDDPMHCFVANGIVTHNSHTYAYAVTSVRTAYLKAYYPLAFAAASMSLYTGYRRLLMMNDLRDSGASVLPPIVNEAGLSALPSPHRNAVLIGLDGIRDVGKFATRIIKDRDLNGPYADLNDLWLRHSRQTEDLAEAERLLAEAEFELPEGFDLSEATPESFAILVEAGLAEEVALAVEDALLAARGINIKILAGLIQSGALDEFGPRLGMMMVSELGKVGAANVIPQIEWDALEKLERERHFLGTYASSHPLIHAQGAIDRVLKTSPEIMSVEELMERAAAGDEDEFECAIYGVVTDMERKVNGKGNPQADFVLQGVSASVLAVSYHTTLPTLDDVPNGTVVTLAGVARVTRPEASTDDGLDSEGNVIAREEISDDSGPRVFFSMGRPRVHGAIKIPVRLAAPDFSDGKLVAAGSLLRSKRGQVRSGNWTAFKNSAPFTDSENAAVQSLFEKFGSQPSKFKVVICNKCGAYAMRTTGRACYLKSGCDGTMAAPKEVTLTAAPVAKRVLTPSEAGKRLQALGARSVVACTGTWSGLVGGKVSDVRHAASGTSFTVTNANGVTVRFYGPLTAVTADEWVTFDARENAEGVWVHTNLVPL